MPIKIKYEYPALGCYNPIAELSQLVAAWTQSPLRDTKTILERMPKKTKLEAVKLAHEQARTLLEKFPQQEILFKQTKTSLEKGGRWNK